MNNKGFYTAIIAIIVVVLLATMANVQTIIGKAKQAEISQQTMFELKTQMQSMQQLLDKAPADAMSDCYNRLTCELLDECKTAGVKDYSKKIIEYYNIIIDTIRNNTGLDCFISNMPQTLGNDNANFSFDLACSKNYSNQFAVKAKKTIQVDKTLSSQMIMTGIPNPDYCELQVKDNQSGTCDVLVNKSCDGIPKELVGYWKADGNPTDSSLKSNDGTWFGVVTYQPGTTGQAFRKDPWILPEKGVRIPSNLSLNITTFTLSAWVYRIPPHQNHMKVIIKPYDMVNSYPWELYSLDFKDGPAHPPCVSANGCPCVCASEGDPAGNSYCMCADQGTPFNEWHHIAGTFDGTSLRIYQDGSLRNTEDVSLIISGITPNNMDLFIGGVEGGSQCFQHNGLIDETKVYNFALTDTEICTVCNEAKPIGFLCNC